MKEAISIIYVLLALPALLMSLFITHELLEAVQADRLLWFMYWTMVPVLIGMSLLQAVIRRMED